MPVPSPSKHAVWLADPIVSDRQPPIRSINIIRDDDLSLGLFVGKPVLQCDLRQEFWCVSAVETLDRWNAEYGLPGACDPHITEVFAEIKLAPAYNDLTSFISAHMTSFCWSGACRFSRFPSRANRRREAQQCAPAQRSWQPDRDWEAR